MTLIAVAAIAVGGYIAYDQVFTSVTDVASLSHCQASAPSAGHGCDRTDART
jgi:hypothetical protein